MNIYIYSSQFMRHELSISDVFKGKTVDNIDQLFDQLSVSLHTSSKTYQFRTNFFKKNPIL